MEAVISRNHGLQPHSLLALLQTVSCCYYTAAVLGNCSAAEFNCTAAAALMQSPPHLPPSSCVTGVTVAQFLRFARVRRPMTCKWWVRCRRSIRMASDVRLQVSYALDRCLAFWCLTNGVEGQSEEQQAKQQQQKWSKLKAYCGSMPCLGGFPYHACMSHSGGFSFSKFAPRIAISTSRAFHDGSC